VKIHFEHNMRAKSQRLVDLKNKAAELERQLSDARVSLERELAQFAYSREEAAPRETRETRHYALDDPGGEQDADSEPTLHTAQSYSHDHSGPASGGEMHSPEGRTEVLVNHGRSSAYYPGLGRRFKVAMLAVFVAALVTILVVIMSSGGASWPSSVAIVQSEAAKACLNPDVKSEPGQVNFACAKATRQILWVFALMTSGDNPNYANAKTGRMGLEPITPVQGGEVAWSLNLHSPYDPFSPTDSIEVAARAINNIVGGATVTGADGNVVVQPGLESNSGNCVRYTGSAAITSRKDFPSLCAEPVTSPAGQAALVADTYKRWVVGAAPKGAQDAAVLFEEAKNPGDPRVQAILKHLSRSKPAA
jgi:hypothetical protein